MRKRNHLHITFVLLIVLIQSCAPGIYPGFYAPQLGPRMIQPISQNGNINALPKDANFVQSYAKYKKTKAYSRFGALVRIIEFEYDITDSFSIIPRITSGYDEGEMTGMLTILLDDYELTYENPNPQVRDYVEEVSYESSRPVQNSQQVHTPAKTDIVVTPEGQHSTVMHPASVSTVYNTIQEKQNQVINRSQLYNSARYIIEDEDVLLLLKTASLQYKIHLQNCNIIVQPTKEQIRILKRMIEQHY